jgi:hypothetical protein
MARQQHGAALFPADAISEAAMSAVNGMQAPRVNELGLLESRITCAFLEAVGSATTQQQQQPQLQKQPSVLMEGPFVVGLIDEQQGQQQPFKEPTSGRVSTLRGANHHQQQQQQQQLTSAQQILPQDNELDAVQNVMNLLKSLQQHKAQQRQLSSVKTQASQGGLLKDFHQVSKAGQQRAARQSTDTVSVANGVVSGPVSSTFLPLLFTKEQPELEPPTSAAGLLAFQECAAARNILLSRLLQQQHVVEQQLQDVMAQPKLQQLEHEGATEPQHQLLQWQEKQVAAPGACSLLTHTHQQQQEQQPGDPCKRGEPTVILEEVAELELDLMLAEQGMEGELDMYDFLGSLLDETDTAVGAGGAALGTAAAAASVVAAPGGSSVQKVAHAEMAGANIFRQAPAAAADFSKRLAEDDLEPVGAAVNIDGAGLAAAAEAGIQDWDVDSISKICLEALLTPGGQ